MASLSDIGVAAAINILSAVIFLLAFAILRLQPVNDRVYFPKWYLKGIRASPTSAGAFVKKFVNLDVKMYLRFLNWMPAALRIPEPELIEHAGLDSAVYIRIYLLGWVLVRNVPPDPDESVSEHVEHFFCVNHPDHYLTHQVAYNANKLAKLVAKKKSTENWLVYYQNKYERNPTKFPTTKEVAERERVISDPKSIIPAAFVSFKSRWGAAVCAQTQQSSNPTIWLTEWAPEPRDVYWDNLSIPYVELTVRRLLTAVALFFLTFCFMIPIAVVQSMANIEAIEKVLPFLKPLIEIKVVKSFIQGFLPGIALKIFLILLPMILMTMSKIEGFTSLSSLDRRSAGKYHLFVLVNVFLGSIITGTALQQLKQFLDQSPTEIPKTVGVSIPSKATFFISYIMVDGWAGIAAEIFRLVPLVMFHIKNTFLVKTEQDREKAMDPGSLTFASSEPRIQLYFLLGLVYSAVTPILLPFIIVFFAFAYLVFRHQDAMVKDTLERATEPNLNLKAYLQDAYIHPVFKGDELDRPPAIDEEENNPLVATKRNSRKGSNNGSNNGSPQAGII
ncbi:hypothetical protein RJ639_006472 [Escallonia herrerae]|uniref:Uncharacterized protein n=1 Tax=Escallonia herrerae TaxID=1293975 RepID=A0AA88VYB0_9ASTE|nr:hypothetical protein RJ639_006472 [Escallonia herrerae]